MNGPRATVAAVAAVLGLMQSSCAPQDGDDVRTQVIPDSIAGCYQMTIDGQLEYELPPQQFTLMSEMGADVFEADNYLIRPVTASPGGRYRWAYWRPLGQDSVLMIWTTGFTVTSVHVEARGDTLHGRIIQRDDVVIAGERDPEARVTVVRSQCS